MIKRILLFIIFSPLTVNAESPLVFQDAYIAEAPPGATVLAGYMKIINNKDQATAITEINSPDFASIQMHRSIIEDGVASMQHLNKLEIAANSELILAPGGLHLMLIDPKQPLKASDNVMLYLSEQDGTSHNLLLTVQKKQ